MTPKIDFLSLVNCINKNFSFFSKLPYCVLLLGPLLRRFMFYALYNCLFGT